jgi:hypothetical protein
LEEIMGVVSREERASIINAALKAEDAKPDAERHLVPWKGSSQRCTVIEIELDVVLLNPRSHRIRAQLDGHPKKAVADRDPYCDEAQAVLSELLRDCKGFGDISASLREEGQRDPGVVTREGILVNANTRAVALRDLGDQYIRVMVLPEGANEQQIAELELRLQVREDLKQEYTFTNELLFIEDCVISGGWPADRIARELGYAHILGEPKAKEKVQHQRRMLAVIKEIRAASHKRIPYSFFDDVKQALIELDQEYEKLKLPNPAKAARVKSARIAGILAGMGYRELRHVSDDFVDRYLRPQVEEASAELRAAIPALLEGGAKPSRGTDVLAPGESSGDPAGGLVEWLTETAGNPSVSFRTNGSTTVVPRQEVVDLLAEAMNDAAEVSRAAHDRDELVEQPTKRLEEARRKVTAAKEALERARTDVRFPAKLKRIEYVLRKLRTEVDDMASVVQAEVDRRDHP